MRALSIILLILSMNSSLAAQKRSGTGEPQLVSFFPIGGQQGTSFDIEVRGQSLEGAYAVWFDCEGLKAEIKKIEEIDLEEDNARGPMDKIARQGNRVLVRVEIVQTSSVGGHTFRLLSVGGISNPLTLQVYAEPVVAEVGVPHQLPSKAQALRFPVIVSGKISKMGEVDFYALDTLGGEDLLFEALAGTVVLDPHLTLYDSTGSWFDSHRPTRLAFDDEPKLQKTKTTNARLTYRFNNKGRYLIAVGAFDGRGGLDYCYQLRIVPLARSISSEIERESFPRLAHREPQGWREREFGRHLEPERLQILSSRSVEIPNKEKTMTVRGSVGGLSSNGSTSFERREDGSPLIPRPMVTQLRDKEPNDTTSGALEIAVPALIEGTIEHPKDVDSFKFSVKAGERLAFEIETSNAVPPRFNPRFAVSDAEGSVILTNVYKTIEPKTLYTFERAGEYSLSISDLTFRHGGPDFIYRLLIRPQVAHMGEVKVSDDQINLTRGEARKLSIVTEQEEGFEGEIALAVENLPPGVQSFPATEVEPDRPQLQEDNKKQWFVPKRQKATIVLLASQEAPLTKQPRFASVSARPIVQGKPGMPVSSRPIPLMVVAEAEAAKSN